MHRLHRGGTETMRSSEFQNQMRPFKDRLEALHKEFLATFSHHYVDDPDPTKKLSEGQANRIDAIINYLEEAVDHARR